MLKNIKMKTSSIPQKGGSHIIAVLVLSPIGGVGGGFFFTFLSKNPCISIFSRFAVLNHSEMAGFSVYSCKHETRPNTNAISRVHNRHPPCEHSRWWLFTTTPTDCEHSWRPLCTRRVAVVHKWWRRCVFQVGNR